MKFFSLAVSACLSTLLFQGCAVDQRTAKSATAPRDGPISPSGQQFKDITPEFRRQILLYSQFKQFLYTAPITDCVIEDGDACVIWIQLVQVSDANGTYCVGLLPESVTLKGTSIFNTPKRIIWKLMPPSSPVANAEFSFHEENDHGVIWLTNIYSPFPRLAQLHAGTIGDGGTNPTDKTNYHVKNRHMFKGEAVYVPVVLQTDTVSGKISLCGTPDPRMVND